MTCGIYKITFASGNEYIGKSLNIERRIDQHSESFYTGTAALSMQREYTNYGMPEARILHICHQDHIDLMESFFIAVNLPQLNVVKPLNPIEGLSEEQILSFAKWCRMSTREHINIIENQYLHIDALDIENKILKATILELKSHRPITKSNLALETELKSTEANRKRIFDELLDTQILVNVLQDKLIRSNKSWWNKLFD